MRKKVILTKKQKESSITPKFLKTLAVVNRKYGKALRELAEK